MTNTVQIIDCFYIEVRGEIAHKFMKYCLDNNIAPLSGIGTSGPNIHTGCYLAEDKVKIEVFFKFVEVAEEGELGNIWIVEEKAP